MSVRAAHQALLRHRALPIGLGIVLAAIALGPVTAARAEFTSATLLSGDQQLQFDEASAPALSADGGYAVFQGTLADVPGVYRRDLQTGEVVLVAGGDAAAPSISADGRYVAFTTTADLEPQAEPGKGGEPAVDRGCPEVYVRDMQPQAGEPEYVLAAALNGTNEGVDYLGGCPAPGAPGSALAVAGAQGAPAVAMSADGNDVVFTVLSRSNLGASPACVPPGVPPEYGECTPPSQVAVRDLQTETTTLVSVEPNGEATPGGGAFPSTDGERQPLNGRGPSSAAYGDQPGASTAAISADGSTVAWLGTNVPAQVPSSAAELEAGTAGAPVGREPLGSEAEPLWRRIADGPGAVTRRLLAGAGIDFFFSEATPDEGNEPVRRGAFVGLSQSVFIPPVLSANGEVVAVLASAPRPAVEPSFRPSGLVELSTDAYVVDVTDDPASPPQVTALTEIPDYSASPAAVQDIKDLAISPDGTRVAFDTARTQFDLPALALISTPSSYTQDAETYEANLQRGTLQRVTSTFDGLEPEGGAGLLSFSGDGQTLAFASTATNLFFGDAVPASEVYLVHELASSTETTPEQIGPAPTIALTNPSWLLEVTASAASDGSVLVRAHVPGSGRLAVSAGAQVAVPAAKRPVAKRSPRRPTHGPRRAAAVLAKRKKSKAKTNGGTAIPTRIVAQGAVIAAGSSDLSLRLRLSGAYGALAAGSDGLYAVLRVTFSAPSEKTLVEEIPVTFRRTARRISTHKDAVRRKAKAKPRGKPRAAK
jgi:hypothetical protein